jgi:aryl-alcohol dehydrogenase-like predicted oxidoreductase
MSTGRREFITAALGAVASGDATGLRAGDTLSTRVLGRTGLKVTVLGFGCAWTSEPSVFTCALDLGVNHFDTAPIYQGGNNEAMLRTGLGARRKQVVLSTKTEASSRSDALRQLENSLRNLATDYVDIWYLHGKDSPGGIRDELVEALVAGKRQGKTRFIGVSTHRLPLTAPRILETGVMDVVLAAYNFTMGKAVEEASASIHNAGIGLVEMKAMAGGHANPAWGPQQSVPEIFRRKDVPAASLRWVIRNPMYASALVGMLSMEEVEEDVAAAKTPFGARDEKILTARLERIRPVCCRMCGACDGACPQGVPVAGVLRCLMYAEGYGQFAFAREEFRRQAGTTAGVRCADCRICAVRCPNGVEVRERLIRAQECLA